MTDSQKPTRVRYIVLALTVCVAVLLYLDRYCLGYITQYVREGLRLDSDQVGLLLGVFFVSYAFGQLPGGWLADRFGTRWMLAIYLAIWSVLTGLTGFASTFPILLLLRLGCGLFEAGAYPACAGLIRRWIPYQQRGLASGIVSLGGRIGGAITPGLTVLMMMLFMPVSTPSLISEPARDILDAPGFARDLLLIPEPDPKLAHAKAAGSLGLMASPFGQGPALASSAFFSGVADKKVPEVAQQLAPRLLATLTPTQRQLIVKLAGLSDMNPPAPNNVDSYFAIVSGWLKQQIANVAGLSSKIRPEPKDIDALGAIVNGWLKQPDRFAGVDLDPIRPKLTRQARGLLDDPDTSASVDKTTRLNRSVLEVVFPGRIRQLLGDGWPPVLMIYGVIGVLVAIVFFLFFRDTPRQHFMVNEAEAKLVEAHEKATEGEPPLPAWTLWKSILTDRSLWASSIVQFGTNFGWIILGNQLALYLFEVHKIPEGFEKSLMASLPFWVALPTLILGGWWTDWMTRKYGPRMGRCFPIATTRFATAAALAACLFLDGAWPVIIILCLMSFVHDLGLPAIWGYNLDVGKRNVGVVLGWGNMWGNLGAAVSPLILIPLTDKFGTKKAGYDAVFLTCALVFLAIGFVSLFIDATKQIGVNESKI